jgi:hypothetical protein
MSQWLTQDDPIKQPRRIHIYGRDLCGKSYLALTAPRDPVALFHCQERLEGTLDLERFKSRDIRRYDFSTGVRGIRESEVQAAALTHVRAMHNVMYETTEWANTIVFDTETDWWTLYKYAAHGREKAKTGKGQGTQRDNWAEVNGLWRMLLLTATAKGADLVIISKESAVYDENGKKTEQIKPKCSPDIYTVCDTRLEVARDISTGTPTFSATVKKFPNPLMLETPFYDSDLPSILETLHGRPVWEVKG